MQLHFSFRPCDHHQRVYQLGPKTMMRLFNLICQFPVSLLCFSKTLEMSRWTRRRKLQKLNPLLNPMEVRAIIIGLWTTTYLPSPSLDAALDNCPDDAFQELNSEPLSSVPCETENTGSGSDFTSDDEHDPRSCIYIYIKVAAWAAEHNPTKAVVDGMLSILWEEGHEELSRDKCDKNITKNRSVE